MTRDMKDSGVEWIGEIPEDWEVSQISRYFNPRNEKVSDIDYKPLSVTKNGIVPQLDNAAKSSNHNDRKLVRKEDFVINSRSDRKMSSGIAKEDGSVSLINIVLFSRNILPMYTNYLLKNYSFAEEFYKWGSGIVADLWSTNWEKMKKINIPIPPVTEQEQIAIALDLEIDKINSIISDTQQSIVELKKYKQSLITETVTKGLDKTVEMKDSGIEWIGNIPSTWELSPLKYLCSLDDEKITQNQIQENELIKYIEIGDVSIDSGIHKYQSYFIQEAPSRARKLVKKGDTIISTVRTYLKSIALIDDDQFVVSTGFAVLRPKSYVNAKFFSYSLKSDSFTENVMANSYGISYPAIPPSEIIKISIAIPNSLQEQQQIVEFLDNKISKIDSLIADKEKMITEYELYKKSLIYEYVTGKKQV